MTSVESSASACPFCAGAATKTRFRHGEFRIMACSGCRGGFALPRSGFAPLEQIYGPAFVERYSQGVMPGKELIRWRYERLTRRLEGRRGRPTGGSTRRVLDIGCASGGLLAEFRSDGWEVQGVEVSPELADRTRARGIPVTVGDVASVEMPAGSFDLITMSHVIEHLPDPLATLARCARWLRGTGMIAVETPNWRGIGALVRRAQWAQITPPVHLSYLGPRAFRRMARRAGFAGAATATTTPPVLEVLAGRAAPVRLVGGLGYRLAALAGLGTPLFGFAWKEGGAARTAPGER